MRANPACSAARGCRPSAGVAFAASRRRIQTAAGRRSAISRDPGLATRALLSLLQWDKVENKTSVIVYGAGGIVVLWLAATIVGALNNIPLVSPAAEVPCHAVA